MRTTPAVANTLQRLEADTARAQELARTLEDELMEEDTPVPEGEAAEGGDADKAAAESKDTTPGLRERGTEAVADVIARLLARDGLDGEDLDEEQQIRKVSNVHAAPC